MKREEQIEKLKEKSLRYSLKDGAASSINSNIEGTYIPQLALAFKGSAFQVGLISAFSGLLSPLSQIIGDKLMEKKSRKKILSFYIGLQVLLIFGIAALAYIFYRGYFQESMIYILIGVYTLVTITSGIIYPAWFSLVGDITSKETRGKFLSKRNVIITIIGLAIIPLGLVLDKVEAAGYLMIGFSAIFAIAGLSRLMSRYFILKHYEPKLELKKGYYFSLLDFIKRFDDVGKFAVYYAVFNLAIMIASPFFAVYMREGLSFDYFQITIISLTSSLFYLVFTPLIGRISDKYGNIKLFFFSCVLFSINPFLWIFIKSFWALAIIPQLVTGVANAALGIAVSNFIYNMSKTEHRALCITYLNILVGIGTFVGSILGGLIIKFIPSTFIISPFICIFIISGISRLFISISLVKKLKETEDNAKKFPRIKIDPIHPLKTLHTDISAVRSILRTK